MSNNVFRARLVLTWCMSVMSVGAWRVVTGADLTVLNAGLLAAACILPPAAMLLMWRDPAPVAVVIAPAVAA
jgi:hypothetical protein